jgi:hypothetical protein
MTHNDLGIAQPGIFKALCTIKTLCSLLSAL